MLLRSLAVALCVAVSACNVAPPSAPDNPVKGHATLPPSQQITHIIVVFQENRSMDYMMHFLPGADVVTAGINSNGNTIVLRQQSLAEPFDISHTHGSWVGSYDNGKMDGFNLEKNTCGNQPTKCMYAYAPQSEVQPLLDMCAIWACADQMFQTNQGPSLPAHQYIVSGTSSVAGNSNDPNNTNPASSNPLDTGLHGNGGGCDSPPNTLVDTINPQGVEGDPVFPCWDHLLLTDELDNAGVSWKYYQNTTGDGLWNAMDYFTHVRYGPDYANVSIPSSNVLSDIQNGTLASVSWVTPSNLNSDHPGNNSATGPSWVAGIVNALGNSGYWNSTAIIVTWDDWGGWYDHVPPKIYDSYTDGFRVPLIVISPYAKTGYVSHVPLEFGSILKFIEETYALPSLGYTDKRSTDLSDLFQGGAPRAFVPISAPYSRAYFLHQKADAPGTDTDGD